MELVETEAAHARVAHTGPAATARAAIRAARTGGTGGGTTGSTIARSVAVLGVYLTMRDACQIAGVAPPSYEVAAWGDYYFTAEDGSVFVVNPGHAGSRLPWGDSAVAPHRIYVAGTRAGQSEVITDAQLEAHRLEGERLYGRYIPGGTLLFWIGPRFIPGTLRSSLPIRENGRTIGYVDENGVHEYRRSMYDLPPLS